MNKEDVTLASRVRTILIYGYVWFNYTQWSYTFPLIAYVVNTAFILKSVMVVGEQSPATKDLISAHTKNENKNCFGKITTHLETW